MAGKPELPGATGIQNVIVYVSDDNFAQAYSLGQQNVQDANHIVQGDGYDIVPSPNNSLVVPSKRFTDKSTIKLVDYPLKSSHLNTVQQGDFYNSIPQSGFSQNVVNDGNFHSRSCENVEMLQEKQTGTVCSTIRVNDDCNNSEGYVDQDYRKVIGAEVPFQGMCYDPVRLESADSSCSSLSSSDDGTNLLHNQSSEMVVYDPNVHATSVVLTVGPPPLPQQTQTNVQVLKTFIENQRPTVTIPYGWKRLLNNGSIIYISPSCTALRSPEQVKDYLLTAGTCKCGLECHFKYDSVFNFDPKVTGKPYGVLPDLKSGNMAKLCNHKRKIIPMPTLQCSPSDPVVRFQRDPNRKKKKRRIGLPYVDGVSVSQIMSREKLVVNQNLDKEAIAPQQLFLESLGNVQQSGQMLKYHDQQNNRMIISDGRTLVHQSSSSELPQDVITNDTIHQIGNMPNVFNSQPRQIIGPGGQIIQVRGMSNANQGNVYMSNPCGPRLISHVPKIEQTEENRVFISRQPTEPTGPGRPNIHLVQVNAQNQQRIVNNQIERNQQNRNMQSLQSQFCGNVRQQQQVQLCNPHRHIRPYNQMTPGFRPQRMLYQPNQIIQPPIQPPSQKMNWAHQIQRPPLEQQQQQNISNVCERVPPLYQHTPALTMCQEDIKRKKVKLGRFGKNRPYRMVDGYSNATTNFSCPNIDIRHIPSDPRTMMMNNYSQDVKTSNPSFMEDPSGYLAQQTALLNNTISRQTGCGSYTCNSPGSVCQNTHHNSNSPLSSASSEMSSSNNIIENEPLKSQINLNRVQSSPCTTVTSLQNNLLQVQSNFDNNTLSKSHQYSVHCRCCVGEGMQQVNYQVKASRSHIITVCNSQSTTEDPVTSSTFEKQFDQSTSDIQPIQGGTVSTSNIEGTSDSPTPEQVRVIEDSRVTNNELSYVSYSKSNSVECDNQSKHLVCDKPTEGICCYHTQASSLVTTMASSRTVGSNTITSVLAGRTNTATVSLNPPVVMTSPYISVSGQNTSTVHSQPMTVSKSPLEMVQSIVSSIQIPHSNTSSQIMKSENVPQEHILITSGEQLTLSKEEMPVTSKIVTNEVMPPITVSPMVTNVTSSAGAVIPAVGQQVLGQQAVLVNALPAPFVLQPGVTMTMDGVPVGQHLQLPQFVTGNIIQQQIQVDNNNPRKIPPMLSPEIKKKGKKRKEPPQTVANMLQFANQQNSGVVISPQGFSPQIQVANSPQSVTTPVMQAVTIVPNKNGSTAQIIMNDQSMANSSLNSQQLLTNSQSAPHINLLQPVNLINGTGVVQNFPAVHQFIVPNLGGMVVNPDGTATILQDTSNLGMQFQFQNVNGQNMLTPVQNNSLFNNGQTIFAAGPSGMVIRTPSSQGKIMQQQHSPVAQFLSPNGGQFIMNSSQFSGQLSPLVASVSPNQQVTFNSPPQQIRSNNALQPAQQEYLHMNGQLGQTLIVPCSVTSNIPASNNNTFLQQNTIVQQQTTMLTNQELQNFQNTSKPSTTSDQIYSNKTIEESRESPKSSSHYRQSVSTQTVVNQSLQSIVTNTSCHISTNSSASPPDTTTLSPVPIASEIQSPILADTTTHTDDGLSPVPLGYSCTRNDIQRSDESQSCKMAMVHCVSSSEPDPLDISNQEQEWKPNLQTNSGSLNEAYVHVGKISPSHLASAESSSLVTSLHYGSDPEAISSSKNFDRKKSGECVNMNIHHEQISLFGNNSSGILTENQIADCAENGGDNIQDSEEEDEEDEVSNEGYLVGSLLINS